MQLMATSYSPYKPKINNQAVQGPGLGWNNDIATFNNNKFSGLVNDRGETLGATSTRGGGGGTPPSPGQIVPSIDPITQEIDNAFNSRISSLNNIANIIRGELPRAEQEANQQFTAQKGTLDASRVASEREITEAGVDAGNRRDDALSSARRAYNDSMIGARQRFGALSTPFQGFGEIAQRSLQQGFGQARDAYETSQRKIADYKAGLEERYGSGLLQLQAVRDNAINQARRSLDNQLLEIERMKGDAAEAKAQRRLAALSDYRQNIFDVNNLIANYKMQMDNEFSLGQQELDSAGQMFSQFGTQAEGAAGEVPNTLSYNVPIGGFGNQPASNPYVGQINPRDEENMAVGAITPRRNVLDEARSAFSLNA